MTQDDAQPHRLADRPPRPPMITDYEDFTKLALSDAQLDKLVGDRGQCVFNWTTRDGYPVGVVMAYVYRDGRFWTNCASHRKRVAALRTRPKCAVVITNGQHMASFKGTATIHAPEDPDWNELKTWFYAAVSGTGHDPNDPGARSFEQFLDGPNQVIIETSPTLVVSFDFATFLATTQAAIATAMTAA